MKTGEQFFAIGVVDHAHNRCVLFEDRIGVDPGARMGHQGDGHRVVRDAAQEVGGAVQGVDVPGGGPFGSAAGLFGHDAVGGAALAQDIENGGFGFAVGLGDQVIARLVVDHQVVAVVRIRLENGRAGMGGAHGDIDGRAKVQRCLVGGSL